MYIKRQRNQDCSSDLFIERRQGRRNRIRNPFQSTYIHHDLIHSDLHVSPQYSEDWGLHNWGRKPWKRNYSLHSASWVWFWSFLTIRAKTKGSNCLLFNENMNCFTLPNILVHQRLILTGLAHLKTLSLILRHWSSVTTNYLHISSHREMALLIQEESFQGFWQAELADGLMAWSTQALPYAQAAELGKSRWAWGRKENHGYGSMGGVLGAEGWCEDRKGWSSLIA